MPFLNPLDTAFLRMESKRTPMHVAGLMIFQLPDDAPPDFLATLYERLRSEPVVTPPYNYRLKRGLVGGVAPSWEVDPKIDIDYHLRHSALPHPGGERELGRLVERLHSHPLDLEKPLWECHLIEGLENRRFAFYMKAHHAALDGFAALRLVNGWLSPDPTVDNAFGPWAMSAEKREAAPLLKAGQGWVRGGLKQAGKQLRAGRELVEVMSRLTPSEENPDAPLVTPGQIPRTQFNGRISQHRRVATQLFELQRFKAMSAATEATINDICLTICGSALRRYLLEQEALPRQSLVASIPIGLPRPDGRTGNRTAGFVCALDTQSDDPVARLKRIRDRTVYTKAHMKHLSDAALDQFSLLGITPLMLGQMSGLLRRLPPLFNLTISNVVASKVPLYLNGAELEAMYPISVLFDGHTLNVTIVGYADRLAIGITGCRESVPNLQRLAVYTGEAMDELEAALSKPRQPRRKKTASRRAGREGRA